VSDAVVEAAGGLRRVLVAVDPEGLSGEECARLAEELAATENCCATVRMLLAARAVAAGAHQARGYGHGAAWLARLTGSSAAQGHHALDAAARLHECPQTKAALLAGDISWAQADEITKTHAELPGAEAELLPTARHADLSQLRDRARDHRQAHTDPAQLRDRQWAARHFRHWRDRDGMIRLAAALPPETGLPLVRRVETAALKARRAARHADPHHRQPFEAHAADALAHLVTATRPSSPDPAGPGLQEPDPEGPDPEAPDAAGRKPGRSHHPNRTLSDLVVVCDLYAWRRGHPHPGEACHIIGGGPIPIDLARELSQDAFIKAVLHDGTNIHTIKHFGRHLPATLRTALDLGPTPQFTGRACADCGTQWGLQYDHIDPVAHHGPTQYDNIQPRCWNHHQAKTERDRQAGLLTPHPPNTS
jgi:Domain of unknown function (DUF222)/HNH endonuclease